MNLHSQTGLTATNRRRRTDSVALVITLLMLSIITFLAIAFLAMSRRNQSSVSASLDVTTAQAMSAAAQARAQAEIMAQIMAHGDPYYYDYMVSRDYISTVGFDNAEKSVYDANNVNYDYFSNASGVYLPFNNASDPVGWVQNIANLYYDPRPPVFVVTNPAYPNNYDFRFWVDINRNGRFETNGYQPTLVNIASRPGTENIVLGPSADLKGEPEWIGMLRNSLFHHSSTNQFIGRYAYLVLPIGKSLDFNYVHNFLKGSLAPGEMGMLTNTSVFGRENDGFARDQGIGSWELNLAGLLDNVSPWAYESNNSSYGPYAYRLNSYNYIPPNPSLYDSGLQNTGNAFDDAEAILHYRYLPPSYYLDSLFRNFPVIHQDFENDYIDIYSGNAPLTAPFDYIGTNYPVAQAKYKTLVGNPWPGSYQTNLFFDPQDLFDPNKTSINFTNRMILASQRTNTFDRYTFERLLSSIGMGSSPEYGVWVYSNWLISPSNPNLAPLILKTKVNVNYDNTAQITNSRAPYAPMPTNLVSWTPIGFFTNAADLLLRSQGFVYSNNYPTATPGFYTYTIITNYCGVTNIPIYSQSNPGVHYDAAVHRMLQLAANIYDATNPTNYESTGIIGLPPVRYPSVFRPLFQIVNPGTTNIGVNIAGYVQVTNDAFKQMTKPFRDVTSVTNPAFVFDPNGNFAGIPWIVAADKGLPAFYHYTCGSEVFLERKLQFPRPLDGSGRPITNEPPAYTNQFYCMAITNSIGLDAWNPYPTAFFGHVGPLCYYYSNYITIQLTNNFNFGTNIVLASSNYPSLSAPFSWKAGGGGPNSKAGILSVFNNTNVVALPESYYSQSLNRFIGLTNDEASDNAFLAADKTQKSWPVYNWTLNVTNHVVYALFDGLPGSQGGVLLDFVNVGPFGYSLSITNLLIHGFSGTSGLGMSAPSTAGNYWLAGFATSLPGSPMSQGVINQINAAIVTNAIFVENLQGKGTSLPSFDCPCKPTYAVQYPTNWVSNDPLVHYTLEDLTWTSDPDAPQIVDYSIPQVIVPLSNTVGKVSSRYAPWGLGDSLTSRNMLFKDPLITGSVAWQFPTNKFPGIGWIGRVHRGTPWQTVFLKADSSQSYALWSNWANPYWVTAPYSPETYPTNDYPLVDLFTAVPNDNAARGLLAVNQTNDAAWAALFAGVIAITNADFGVPINPQNDVQFLMDSPGGINALRALQPNGIFHKIGYILGAPALTTNSPFFLNTNAAAVPNITDDVVERIPQQVLSLLKVGEPQFVVFAWGQSLKPKGPPFLGFGANANTYTNYEITGEFLTRTVCHLVHTNGLKMVIDSYNVESGN
jgi:hypothetical protein